MSAGPDETMTRSLMLAPDLAQVALARTALSEIATEAGFGEARVFDIMVASSEAIANAIEHAPVKGQVGVTATIHADRLEIQVEGPGEFQAPDRQKERNNRGLGLPMMAKLADHLALFSGPRGGTLVSLTFYRPGAPKTKEGTGALPPSIQELIDEHESERRLKLVLDNSLDGINLLDLTTGKYVIMNPAQAAMTGFSMEELNGISVEEAYARVHPDDRDVSIEQQKRVVAGEDIDGAVEYRWKVKSGEYRWFSDRRKLVRDEAGRPIALVGISRDITERKRAEEALRRSEARYRLLHESLRDAFVEVDMSGRIVDFNDAFRDMLGYSARELHALTYRDLTPAAWWNIEERIVQEQIIPNGHSEIYEKEYRRKDGTIFPIELRTILTRNQKGEPCTMWAIVRDISERKRAEHLDRVLLEATNVLHSSLRSEDLLERALALGAEALGADAAALDTWQGDGFRVSRVYGVSENAIGQFIPATEAEYGVQAVRTRQTVAVDDVRGKTARGEPIGSQVAKSMIVAPCLLRDEPVAALYFDFTSARHAFSDAEKRFVSQFASTFSLAMENALLYEEQRQLLDRLQNCSTPTG